MNIYITQAYRYHFLRCLMLCRAYSIEYKVIAPNIGLTIAQVFGYTFKPWNFLFRTKKVSVSLFYNSVRVAPIDYSVTMTCRTLITMNTGKHVQNPFLAIKRIVCFRPTHILLQTEQKWIKSQTMFLSPECKMFQCNF